MKKKLLVGAIAVSALATVIGTSVTAIPKHVTMDNPVVDLAANVDTNSVYYRKWPEKFKQSLKFNYGGICYSRESISQQFQMTTSENAATEEVLILYAQQAAISDISGIEFERYTGLKDLIIVANDLTPYLDAIKRVPAGVNLYLGGGLNLGTSLSNTKFTNLYLSYLYNPLGNCGTSEFVNSLANSNITNVYYNDYAESFTITPINQLKGKNPVNSKGSPIKIAKDSIKKYPDLVFEITESVPKVNAFGAKVNYDSVTAENNITSSNLKGTITGFESGVKDSTISLYENGLITNPISLRKIYFNNCRGYDFTNVTCDEAILRPASTTVDLNKMGGIKNLRLIRTNRPLTLAPITSSINLGKIYIPNSYKQNCKALIDAPELASKIAYYDDTSYDLNNAYLASDGKEIKVSSYSLTIPQCENIRKKLDAMNLNYDNQCIDKLIEDYNIAPVDKPVLKYSHRPLEKIVIPKNMDAKLVLNEYKSAFLLGDNYITYADGLQMTVDYGNYTIGTNATITINLVYPDGLTDSFDVQIENIPEDGKYAYMVGSRNIGVVLTTTTTNTSLKEIMSLYEKHYFKQATEYSASPILNTTEMGFDCNNTYSIVGEIGAIQVLTTYESLIPGETTPEGPDVNPEVPEVKPEVPDPGEGFVDTDGIDTVGMTLKNPIGIYTPASISGSMMFAGLRSNICKYNGAVYPIEFVRSYTPHDNTANWELTLLANVGYQSKDTYKKVVDVNIINSTNNIGFVMFDDGTVAVEFNSYENYTAEQINKAFVDFMTSQKKTVKDVKIPIIEAGKTVVGSYDGGEILVVSSNRELTFNDMDHPIDQTAAMKDYQIPEKLFYTQDLTPEQAMRLLGDKIFRKDGVLVKGYDIKFTYTAGGVTCDYVITKLGKKLKEGQISLIKVTSKYSYLFATMDNYDTGNIIINRLAEKPAYNLDNIMAEAIKNHKTILTAFDSKKELDFTKDQTFKLDGAYQHMDSNYYKYSYEVSVMDIATESEKSGIEINGEAGKDSLQGKFNGFFDGLKKKFEENKAFKAFTIAFGTITGLALLYGLYVIFKKIYKWLRG